MRLPHATLVPLAVAATVFVTALGSSSVAALTRVGQPVRWFALLALLASAAVASVARSRRPGGLRPAAAAGLALIGLALVSACWSVQPRLTAERALSLTLLVAAAAFAAYAAAGDARFAERLVAGVLGGGAGVALAGLLLLAVDRGAAVHAASVGVPARYQGIGQSPNTVALLLALLVPLATWVALARRRVVGLAALALFWGSLSASGSRGGLVGALVGSLVVAALSARGVRGALLVGAAACAVFAVAVALGQLARPGVAAPGPGAAAAGAPSPRYPDLDRVFPLTDDLGRSLPGSPDVEGRRTLFGSSGRTAVWRYALGQAWQRPVAGFGFGTEEKVFVDRFADFEGGRVENSYVGWLLQLGVAGLVAFLGVVAAVVAVGRRGLRGPDFGPAAAGALAAGLVAALVQSYVYSAGNIAALSFWLAAGLVAIAAVPSTEVA